MRTDLPACREDIGWRYGHGSVGVDGLLVGCLRKLRRPVQDLPADNSPRFVPGQIYGDQLSGLQDCDHLAITALHVLLYRVTYSLPPYLGVRENTRWCEKGAKEIPYSAANALTAFRGPWGRFGIWQYSTSDVTRALTTCHAGSRFDIVQYCTLKL